MKAKFAAGELVRTVAGALQGEGPVIEVRHSSRELQLLWGVEEPHYLIRDNQSSEFISVIERYLEKA